MTRINIFSCTWADLKCLDFVMLNWKQSSIYSWFRCLVTGTFQQTVQYYKFRDRKRRSLLQKKNNIWTSTGNYIHTRNIWTRLNLSSYKICCCCQGASNRLNITTYNICRSCGDALALGYHISWWLKWFRERKIKINI